MVEPPASSGGPVLFGDRYQLGPVIGQGGMAEVRSGRDVRLDRPVAVKLLRRDVAHQPGVRSRFETEARLAARLIHPNVVAVFDTGEYEDVPYIVMERLPGDTLGDRLAKGPMPPAEVEVLALQVLAALRAAHDAGIVHRDIKPGNVLAAPGGSWKVADFGIAKALELGGADITATGLLIGTPAYLAPERFFGAPASVASDLYSLGVVLFQALTGRRPFDSDRLDAWAPLVSAVPAPPVSSLRPDAGPALAAVIDRCLAKDPSDRFWSAAEMAAVISAGIRLPPDSTEPVPAAGAEPGARGVPTVGPVPAFDAVAATKVLAGAAAVGTGPVEGDPPATRVLPRSGRLREAGVAGGGLLRRFGARSLAAAIAAVALVVLVIAVSTSGGGRGRAGTTTSSVATTTSTAPTTTTTTTTTTTVPPTTAPPPGAHHSGPGGPGPGGGGPGHGGGGKHGPGG